MASDRHSNKFFGNSVSLSGNHIIVGAYYDNVLDGNGFLAALAGSAYIFRRNNSGEWNEVQKLVASDRASNDHFGYSVCISGDNLVVGAPYEDEDATGENTLAYSGSAYAFRRSGDGTWNQIQKIVSTERIQGEYTGVSVGITGNYVIAGTLVYDKSTSVEKIDDEPEAAYIFEACDPSGSADPDNIIENGDFGDCILSPWSVYNDPDAGVTCDALLTNGKCIMQVFNPSSSSQYWDVLLTQELSAAQIDRLEKDATYNLSFDARAIHPKTCRISFERNEDPWTPLLDEIVTIGTEMQSYSYEFVAHTIWSAMELTFQVGIDATPVILDNVRLVKVTSPTINNEVNNIAIGIFLNPASDYFEVSSGKLASISLYNSLGNLVRKLKTDNNNNRIPVADLPDGLYFIEISSGNTVSVQRIVIQH